MCCAMVRAILAQELSCMRYIEGQGKNMRGVCKKWARGQEPKRALQIARMTQIESDRGMSVTYSYYYERT